MEEAIGGRGPTDVSKTYNFLEVGRGRRKLKRKEKIENMRKKYIPFQGSISEVQKSVI